MNLITISNFELFKTASCWIYMHDPNSLSEAVFLLIHMFLFDYIIFRSSLNVMLLNITPKQALSQTYVLEQLLWNLWLVSIIIKLNSRLISQNMGEIFTLGILSCLWSTAQNKLLRLLPSNIKPLTLFIKKL